MRSKFVASFIILILVDQITKAFFATRDFFLAGMHFHLVRNFGLSFGVNFGTSANLLVIIFALVVFLYFIFRKLQSTKINFAIVMISAGAVANLIDRLRLGYVRDFWDIRLGFTFNFADLFIFFGLLIILFADNTDKLGEMPKENSKRD